MRITHYSEKPQPYLIENTPSGLLQITIAANPRQEEVQYSDPETEEEAQQSTNWIADTDTYFIAPGELDLTDVAAHPENYLDYATLNDKKAALRKVQQWKDHQIESNLKIPTHLGWDVEYSLDALIDAMGVFLMLLAQQPLELTSWADAAGEEHAGLSSEDIIKIALAIALYRLNIQKKKNTAHNAVKAAHTNTEIKTILDNLE